jgi:uncharacterized protein YndB with AHSA1/START domain
VPTARASRTIAAPAQQLWEIVSDPHHLPRWWPRVERVEDVRGGEFTKLMRTSKGKAVRADFERLRVDEQQLTVSWSHRLKDTPFERVLRASETEITLAPLAAGEGPAGLPLAEATHVTIELRQAMAGFFPRFGGFMARRASTAILEQALDGLERISA